MPKLSAAEVARSGRTVRGWKSETRNVYLGCNNQGFSLRFSLNSKGGGITDVKLTIGPDDFPAIASSMVEANRERAIREMATEIANEMAKQSDHERILVQKARDSV